MTFNLQNQSIGAPCKHENVLTYDLKSSDQADFCRRLNHFLHKNKKSVDSGDSDSRPNYLTPDHLRSSQRALSSRSTRDTKHGDRLNRVGSTDSPFLELSTERTAHVESN